VEANLTGHDSHGVTYYSAYSNRIKEGHIDVKADPKTVKETPSSALVDGGWAPGQITAMYAMELAVKKAKENDVSAVGAYNCNHIGRVGYYTNWAAERDIIAMMFVNVGNPSATVFNGTTRVFGTLRHEPHQRGGTHGGGTTVPRRLRHISRGIGQGFRGKGERGEDAPPLGQGQG